ncbi:hypothetical protein MD484_g2222, partial [Candolleomyces efflorescens]
MHLDRDKEINELEKSALPGTYGLGEPGSIHLIRFPIYVTQTSPAELLGRRRRYIQHRCSMNILGGSQNVHVEHFNATHVDSLVHIHSAQVRAEDKSLHDLLQPIQDASHTRDRKRSPPDSACTRGTRVDVVQKVTIWTAGGISAPDEPHILWMHGYVGSGKSAISQEVCTRSERQGRPVASFFFFRNAGDRSKIWRLAPTLANDMAAVVPEMAPFIRAAVTAKPGLTNFPVRSTSVAMQMQRLVYSPFKAATGHGPIASLAGHPFLIVIDGLDECEDKEEIQDLVEGMLLFFEENPFVPLRVFITSRVEQHIQSHLDGPGVLLTDLVDYCSDADIETFLDVLFASERRRNPIMRAYIRQNGAWPAPHDKQKLVQHIGGSFIFASTVFKFIMGSTADSGSTMTPMDRLPLALKMNPDFDDLYAQTLARSQHLPHFLDIISTIAHLEVPLPTSGIAELLGISIYEVVTVLVNLQAIILVPGTDDIPVTLFHTSLREFLTTQSRSNSFFAHPRQHVRLLLCCLQSELTHRYQGGLGSSPIQRNSAAAYALRYSEAHLLRGQLFFESGEWDYAMQLCREMLELSPDSPELIQSLARVRRRRRSGSLEDLEEKEAVSPKRRKLNARPSSHLDPSHSLRAIGDRLVDHYRRKGSMVELEEVISLFREELELRPYPHPDRPHALDNLAVALNDRHRWTKTVGDIEEVIFLYREALELRPAPHPDRPFSLSNLGDALRDRYQHTRTATDLEEAIILYREAVELQPSPSSESLHKLDVALRYRYQRTKIVADLKESNSLGHEAFGPRPYRLVILPYHSICQDLHASLYPIGPRDRLEIMDRLTFVLQERSGERALVDEEPTCIARLKAQARRLAASTFMT